ncbi:MAG: glycine zipper 2TM domain-containing protein [Pseudomonadota bacterium]
MTHMTQSTRIRMPIAAALGALTLVTAGCATTYGANEVNPNAVRTAATVRPAVVQSVRQVTIRPQNSGVGAGAGALIGGLLGSQVGGRDTTQAIGAVGGAVLGGLAGNAAGRAAQTGQGLAYVVQFENGEIREIIQGADVYIAPGTPVNVTFRADGAIVSPAA